MRWRLFFLLCWVLFSPTHVLSQLTCERLFPVSPDRYKSYSSLLHRSEKPSLDIETMRALMSHPIFHLPRQLRAQNVQLQFEIQRGIWGETFPTDPTYKGEHIQGRFVKEILRYLFPDAPIAQKLTQSAAHKTISFWIEDIAETPAPLFADSRTWLDMTVLKTGNPGLYRFDRADLRQDLGLPLDRRVVSIYLRRSDLLQDASVRKALIDLATEKGFQDLYISSGTGFNDRHLKLLLQLVPGHDQIFALTKTTEATLREPRRWIYNDTVGLLSQIHTIADMSVVVGAVNFFEPLAVKTPTVLFLPPASLHHYNISALLPMIRVASLSPGFADVYDMTHWSGALRQTMQTPREKMLNPAHISQNNNPSAFHQVLNMIQEKLLEQLYEKNSEIDF